MDYSITNAWVLIDKMRRNREYWFIDLGSEVSVEINYDCLHAFIKIGKVEELASDLYLDDGIVYK
jgi:hypothetical protein